MDRKDANSDKKGVRAATSSELFEIQCRVVCVYVLSLIFNQLRNDWKIDRSPVFEALLYLFEYTCNGTVVVLGCVNTQQYGLDFVCERVYQINHFPKQKPWKPINPASMAHLAPGHMSIVLVK